MSGKFLNGFKSIYTHTYDAVDWNCTITGFTYYMVDEMLKNELAIEVQSEL